MENKILVNKLTLYRIKPEFIGNELSAKASQLEDVSNSVVIYCDNSIPKKPKYLKRFFKMPDKYSNRFFTASSQLLVLVKNLHNSEELAFSFGSGRFLLNSDAVDDRFGLRTALNIVDSEEIKNFSKTVLESNPKKHKRAACQNC